MAKSLLPFSKGSRLFTEDLPPRGLDAILGEKEDFTSMLGRQQGLDSSLSLMLVFPDADGRSCQQSTRCFVKLFPITGTRIQRDGVFRRSWGAQGETRTAPRYRKEWS